MAPPVVLNRLPQWIERAQGFLMHDHSLCFSSFGLLSLYSNACTHTKGGLRFPPLTLA